MQLLEINEQYPNKKLVIILDSIDQLDPYNYSLDWFIDKIPKNVKMIYSTLPTHGSILEKLKTIESLKDNFIQIKSLNKELCVTILQDWLQKEKRNISETQWTIINEMLQNAVLFPLYIKLIFDIIVKWPSFEKTNKSFTTCLNIDACIKYLFIEMESIHGKLLFSRVIIYMSTFKNGISENEIEDILSIGGFVINFYFMLS